jgi:hypothetical protein
MDMLYSGEQDSRYLYNLEQDTIAERSKWGHGGGGRR